MILRTMGAMSAKINSLIKQGQFKAAITHCEHLLRKPQAPWHYWLTLSELYLHTGQIQAALKTIMHLREQAPKLEQKDQLALFLQQARCYLAANRLVELNELLHDLADEKSGSTGLLTLADAHQNSLLGGFYTRLDQHQIALRHYQLAVKQAPQNARHYYNVACIERALGQLDHAEAHFKKAVALNPQDYESIKLISDLRTQTEAQNHVAELKKLLLSGIQDPKGACDVSFALAKELEDLGQWQKSFNYLESGNNLRRRRMKYDVNNDLETLAALEKYFDSNLLTKTSSPSISGIQQTPIFVLGMPRTGTTLVERVLSSHSEVYSAGELTNFARQMVAALPQGLNRTQLIQASTKMNMQALGQAYLRSTHPMTQSHGHFVDKLPLNYLYIGLIHLALPQAKIIHLRRDPMDTCYSVYKQLFADAYPFSYQQD